MQNFFPKCRSLTIGPNSNNDKSTSIGVAAHICAASKAGPRYDASMSEVERKSAHNGIWLCSNCSALIDKDVEHFSIDTLKSWKLQTENYVADRLLSNKDQNHQELNFKILELVKELNNNSNIVNVVSDIFSLSVQNNLSELREISSRELFGWYSRELPQIDRSSAPKYRLKKVLLTHPNFNLRTSFGITASEFLNINKNRIGVFEVDYLFAEPLSELESKANKFRDVEEEVMCQEIEKGQIKINDNPNDFQQEAKMWFLSSNYYLIISELKRFLNRKLIALLDK